MENFEKIMKRKEKDLEKAHKERMEKCIPIARKVLKVLAQHADTLPMGDVEPNSEGYQPCALAIAQTMLDEKINWADRDFIGQLVLQAVQNPQQMLTNSFNRSWEIVLTGLFGKPYQELTIAEVDVFLKSGNALTTESEA